MTAEEHQDDGDEDDGQTGLSLLSYRTMQTSAVLSIKTITRKPSLPDGFKSYSQVDPEVEEQEDTPWYDNCHE